jgi:3alpha(or 20beta)-hydroxysteroid dehydrogenase
MGRLDGKVAIITGGARGMGEATSRLFAAEGAKVVIADILPEGQALAEEIGGNAIFIKLDVSSEAEWQALDRRTREVFGPATVLVNNAGINTVSLLVELDYARFVRTLEINLGGTFLGMKTIAPGMIAAGGGSIINISSTEGLQGTNGFAAYASSKWGVRGLTKVAAMELSHQGVRVNSVHPGPVNTPMGNPENLPEATLNQLFASLPMGRAGRPEEVAKVSLFLASDDASFVTGAELAADGGMTIGQYLPFTPGRPAAMQG